MEPFRPFVDLAVHQIAKAGDEAVTPEAKRALARVLAFDLTVPDARGPVVTPVTGALSRLAVSLGQSFESGRLALVLPERPLPLALAALGR